MLFIRIKLSLTRISSSVCEYLMLQLPTLDTVQELEVSKPGPRPKSVRARLSDRRFK